MNKNTKITLLCLICLLFFPLLATADTAYVKIYPADDRRLACSLFDRPLEEVKRDILANLKNINGALSDSDKTFLHFASINGTPEILKFILDNGADIEVRDSSSSTPLYLAAMTGRSDLVKILLEYGANPNCNCSHNPIHTAFTGYINQLRNDIGRKKSVYPKEPNELSNQKPCRPRSYQEYGYIIQMLWPVTQLEEEILEIWKKDFYFNLHSKLTKAELDKEWEIFTSMIKQP